MYEIVEVIDKKIWDGFLEKNYTPLPPLFQTWEWGEVQKKMHVPILRLGVKDEKKDLVGICLITYVRARRGTFLHVRHGPILKTYRKDLFSFFIAELKKIAKKKDAAFIRISPFIKKETILDSFFKDMGFLDAPIHKLDAEVCWVLSLEGSFEELLKNMRKSHRYLIKKSQNMGITIHVSKKEEDISKFLPLYKDLSRRKHFIPHKGIQEEFEVFQKSDSVLLFLAEYEKETIAGALVLFLPDMAIYHHSASLEAYKHIPAQYLIQWEIIQQCKKRGIGYYNFWGISLPSETRHPWKGLSLFKTGFGGDIWEFVHAKDLPLNLWYWRTYAIEYLTKIRKGY